MYGQGSVSQREWVFQFCEREDTEGFLAQFRGREGHEAGTAGGRGGSRETTEKSRQ